VLRASDETKGAAGTRHGPDDISIWSESLVLRQRIALTTFFHATNVRPRKPFYLHQGAFAM
jgi:hypothetical protein